jgi:hypothetical protein
VAQITNPEGSSKKTRFPSLKNLSVWLSLGMNSKLDIVITHDPRSEDYLSRAI